ncbi:MAG: type IV secretory system conjugative DNA transfer family protein [Actinobacteria bacterium]|nr:type IV secretory system conjugative DNA transfer family protein [Actinomycetota bacterium]
MAPPTATAKDGVARNQIARSPGDALFEAAVVAVGALGAAIWGGAGLAARLGGESLRAGLGDALVALVHLPGHLSDPAAAWPDPAGARLPGPLLYWSAQALVLVSLAGLGALGWRVLRPRRPRDGLGVDRSARFATRADLDPVRVEGPVPGRLVLGRVQGRLVATEPRTSLCVVGPSQSGKTSGLAVPLLLELGRGGGAAIATSVKGDVASVTMARRAALGEVKVFDPTCVLVGRSATWSPLRSAHTVTGAQAAARGLTDVAAKGGLADGDFWLGSAKELLWPLFYVAACGGKTMRDVVRWVTTHDRPLYDRDGNLRHEGEVHAVLRQLDPAAARRARAGAPEAPGHGGEAFLPFDLGFDQGDIDEVGSAEDDAAVPNTTAHGDDEDELTLAAQALGGIWGENDRTRSSIYTTARTVIEAWSDPIVARAADGCEITPEWLLSGDNTLFVVAPSRDQARLRPVFAGLVADLVHSAFDMATRSGGELDTKLLALLDEAANICPVRELPAWCSTCPSHGITLVTVWQDRSQQRQRYSADGAETIWNNSGAKVILSGLADHATAEVTRLLGEEDDERTTTSVDLRSGQRSVSTQTARRPLVTEDSLRRQSLGQGLLIYRHLPAMRLELRPWHEDRGLKALQKPGAAPPADQDPKDRPFGPARISRAEWGHGRWLARGRQPGLLQAWAPRSRWGVTAGRAASWRSRRPGGGRV